MSKQAQKHVKAVKARANNKLAEKIHKTVLAIDSELITTTDWQYRNRLVEIAYALRDLEEWMKKDGRAAKSSPNSKRR